jgi:aspartate kinase
VVLVAGFQGIDEDENIVTLGRGGSDTTAVALAAALDAQECEIYTDVDGIYTTDPRIFKNAAKMKQISFDEMLELASLGSSVMYVRAIEVGKNHNVKIHVRSSSEETEGTMIIPEESQMEEVVVSGATVQKDIAMITLTGIDNKPGNIANIFAQLAKAKVAVSGITKTEISTEKANLSFTVGVLELNAAKETLEQIKDKVSYENITIREDVASVSVVGVGMRTHYDVAEKMFASLAKTKINIHSITSSQISISCVVDETQAEKALQAVCAAFELDKPAGQRSS